MAANLSLVGVNLSGGEFGSGTANYGTNYKYPTDQEIAYEASKGMNVIRVPFTWERMQQSLFSALDPTELGRLDHVVSYATSLGLKVDLDAHNYGKYNGQLIGSSSVPDSAFADLWSRLAANYVNNPNVMFGLMNEPAQTDAQGWVNSQNAAINAIRQTGATQEILVSGINYDGAWTWVGSPNDTVISRQINDPQHNTALEVHQYLDQDGSGTHYGPVSGTNGVDRISAITTWAEQNHQRLFLGEIGVPSDVVSTAALGNVLSYMNDHSDAWQGVTYWAAGPLWRPFNGSQDYPLSAEPTVDAQGIYVDSAQMKVLEAYAPTGGTIPTPVQPPPVTTPTPVQPLPVTTPTPAPPPPVTITSVPGGTDVASPGGPATVDAAGTIPTPAPSLTATIPTPAPSLTAAIASVPASTDVAADAESTVTATAGSAAVDGSSDAGQPTAADTVSLSPQVSFRRGVFTITGSASSASGVANVEITATLGNGVVRDLGAATVEADGSFTFADRIGPRFQGFITATETDRAGRSASAQALYSLQGGLNQDGVVAEQDVYAADGSGVTSVSQFARDGSRTTDIMGEGQTFTSDTFDTFDDHHLGGNTFVFNPGYGSDVVTEFRLGGAQHDTLSFAGEDFGNSIAAVLRHTQGTADGVVIHDPTSGDTVQLTGVTKAALIRHQGDLTFHA